MMAHFVEKLNIRSHGVTEVISHSIISDIAPWAASGWQMSDGPATDTPIPYHVKSTNQTKILKKSLVKVR